MDKYHHRHHITKHPRFWSALHNKYNDLVIADTFRILAISMISLFVPIFLLTRGFSILEVAMFELVICFASLVAHYLVLQYLTPIGVKKLLIISYILKVGFFFYLYNTDALLNSTDKYFFLLCLGLINVLAVTIYWSAHHIYFFKSTDKKHSGAKAGLLMAVPAFTGVSAPLIGGGLIENASFRLVFLISACLMILASIALLFTSDIRCRTDLSLKQVVDARNPRKNAIFFIHGAIFPATGFAWPLLLFFLSINLVSIGFLYLLSGAVNSLIMYLVGKNSDLKGSKKFIHIGVTGHSFTLILRALAESMAAIFAIQTFGGFFGGFLDAGIVSGFYRYSFENCGNMTMNRELYMYLGRCFMYALLVALLFVLPVKTALVFILVFAGFLELLLNIIIQKDHTIIS